MLKINLLPIRQLKKRAKARNQIVGFLVIFLAVIAVLAFVGVFQANSISSSKSNISDLEKEKAKYTPILAKIDKLKKDKAILENRIRIIKKLEKDSSLTVHILDEVANIIDNERMWLQSLNQQGGSLGMKGVALDNQTVAQFMNNLKASAFVRSVNLSSSSLKKISGKNFKSFSISCAVGFPQPKQKKVAVN